MLLLNSMSGQVDTKQKQLLGSLGAVEKLVKRITEKFNQGVCDAVMELGWSALWNVTDEVPKNCEIFVTCGGINLFLRRKERFLESSKLVRNMVRTLGDLAETQTMRSVLMTKEILQNLNTLICVKN